MQPLPEITKPLNLARGIFFVVEFSAKGGVTYKRVGKEYVEEHEDEYPLELRALCRLARVGLAAIEWWDATADTRSLAVPQDAMCDAIRAAREEIP